MIENINLNGATVSAELHGFMYNNVFGYTGVFKYGSAMEAEIVSNNEIKIKDGLLSNCGRFMRISGYETLAIENGTSGVARTDLIVAHFETDEINETHDLRVIKGASGGEVPSYTTGDIYSGDTINELPLYAIHLNGLTVESVEKLFGDLLSFDELRNNISNPNLLINSDFRNPVNQRGQTSYTLDASARTYTIDRWCSANAIKVVLEDDGIHIYNTGSQTYGYLLQYIETPLIVGEKYTISAKINGVICSHTFIAGEGFNMAVPYFTYDPAGDSLAYDRIGLRIEDSYLVEYIKLEQGSIATPLVPRPYGEELALCQRYYLIMVKTSMIITRQRFDSNISYYSGFVLPNEVRTVGTATYESRTPDGIVLTGELQAIIDRGCVNYFNIWGDYPNVEITKFVIDAEIY